MTREEWLVWIVIALLGTVCWWELLAVLDVPATVGALGIILLQRWITDRFIANCRRAQDDAAIKAAIEKYRNP